MNMTFETADDYLDPSDALKDDSRVLRRSNFPSDNAYFENVTELITDLLNHRLRLPYPLHIAIRRTPPRLKAILYRLMPIDYLPVSVREDIQIFDFSKEVGFETIDVYILIDQQTAMVTIEFSCRIHIPKGRVPLADWICARQTECLPCGTALFDRTIPDRYLIKNSIPFQNCFCGDTFSETYHSLELSLKKCIPEIRELRRKKLPEKYQTIQNKIMENMSAAFGSDMS